MAREQLITIRELTDSKEILLMEPHPFFRIFSLLFAGMLLIGLIWSGFSEIDVFISAGGVVRPSGNISTVRVIAGGKISEVNLNDGQHVEKGDVLLSFDQQSLRIQYDDNQKRIDELNEDLELLNLYRECISTNENIMTTDTNKGRQYSLLVDSYLLDRQIAFQQISESANSSESLRATAQLAKESAQKRLNSFEAELELLEVYKSSIEDEMDYISSSSKGDKATRNKYISQFQTYQSEMSSLQNSINMAYDYEQSIKSNVQSDTMLDENLAQASAATTAAVTAKDTYKNNALASADQAISTAEQNLSSAEFDLKTAENQVKAYSGDNSASEMQIEMTQMDMLTDIDAQIASRKDSISALKTTNAAYSSQLAEYEVIAPINGVLNLTMSVNAGDVVASGTEIGNIVPHNTETFKVLLTVPNSDIAGIKIGDEVKFRFSALPYQEYGVISGEVTNIASDVQTDPATGERFFMIEATIDNKTILGHSGNEAQIRVGMTAQGQIVSERKTVLKWLLERLNFI
ncbi:MAG: HlyD family secretion protein [Clostridiales bacterium]|jgi:HlyD family secretion protein|nr:HlyD family secretion protein [Clostridiales bacterium]